MTAKTIIDSPVGPLVLTACPRGLTGLVFAGGREDKVAPEAPAIAAADPQAEAVIAKAARQLDEYFAGSRTEFDLPLDVEGSDFQKRVWRAIAATPFGQTTSYSGVAAAAGNARAYRAAGTACGANPVAIVVPCHRVVGSDRGLHGFGGGLDVKRWLLAHERGGQISVGGPLQPPAASGRQAALV